MLRLTRQTAYSLQIINFQLNHANFHHRCFQNTEIHSFRWSSQSSKNVDVKVDRKKTFIATGLIAACGLGFAYYIKREKDLELIRERKRELKKVSIGGKWELQNPEGKTITSDNFKGKWCIIYFGFTHCPDICPDEMEKMTGVVKALDARSVDIEPIFITVDPERDTKEVVGKYVKEFSEKIIGLTGTPEEIQKVAHAYRVYYKAGPKDKENDYIVDHTITLYLVDPNGEFVDYYGLGKNVDDITNSVLVNIDKWKTLNSKKKFFF